MDELLEQFLSEGRDLLSEAEDGLRRLALNSADTAALDSAFRAIHTLKGSVAIFDLTPAERVLHAAEDILSLARKTGPHLRREQVAALTACMDQIDRWIDSLEHETQLGSDAESLAAALIALLGADGRKPNAAPSKSNTDAPAWLPDLIAREQDVIDEAEGGLFAFRYTPDPDCFFRGDDPLAMVAAVPDLLSVALHPAEAWPPLAEFDPFRCALLIEGLSRAALPDLRSVFRLVPDQVEFAEVRVIPPVLGGETAADAGIERAPRTPSRRVLRVDAARLDRLGEDLGELIVATNGLALLAQEAEKVNREFASGIRLVQVGIERAAARLRGTTAALRQVALAPSLRRLPRLVREISRELGKLVRFEMHGEGQEVDKDIADWLFEPLLHLARNAVDHGIEDTETRAAAGKPVEGRITLRISRAEGELIVTLEDDGRGIDPERVRELAVRRSLIEPDAAARLRPAELQRLIFAPGFSMAAKVTGLSGRGIGMDAVRTAVDRLGGRIELDSGVGAGTRIVLRLPVSAMTTRMLVIGVDEQRYGIPFDHIREIIRTDRDHLFHVGKGQACVFRDKMLPVLSLAALLGRAGQDADELRLLVVDREGGPVGLQVDGLAHSMNGFVRPRTGLLSGVSGIQGTTLLPDGSVLLVLDVLELIG